MMVTIDRSRLQSQLIAEEQLFLESHPNSRAMYDRARLAYLGGVPMLWMMRWAGSFPIFVHSASGAHFMDVDGHTYVDFCLGDTGAMTGHAPAATVRAISEQAGRGATLMLPYEDALWVAE